MTRTSTFVAALVSLATLASVDAFAENGVAEINQACASQSGASAGDDPGCFLGDTDGLPVEITQPGSYRLTGNLELSGSETAAIVVSASNMSLDLNGFSVSCSVTSCPGGDGLPNGITGSGTNVAVRNGSITGMDGKGVYLSGDFARAEDVRAISNWGDGFHLGSKCVVIRSSAISNGGAGFRTTAPNCGGTANAAITNTGGDFVPSLPALDPQALPDFRVFVKQATTVTLVDGAPHAFSDADEVWDTADFHSGSNPNQFCAPVSGTYYISGSIRYNPNSTSRKGMNINLPNIGDQSISSWTSGIAGDHRSVNASGYDHLIQGECVSMSPSCIGCLSDFRSFGVLLIRKD